MGRGLGLARWRDVAQRPPFPDDGRPLLVDAGRRCVSRSPRGRGRRAVGRLPARGGQRGPGSVNGGRDPMASVRGCGWLSAAVLGVVIAGCSPTGATVRPRVPEHSVPAQPSAAPTSLASLATTEASQVAAPLVLMVTCEGTRTDIPMPLVRAQADGIHIHVANRSGTALDIQIEDASGATLLGETIPIVGGTFISTFGPG